VIHHNGGIFDMTPSEFLATLRTHWATVVVLGIIGASAGFGLARLTPESFQSTSSVFVSAQRGDSATELVQGSTFTQNIVQSYAELATMPMVLEPVIERLQLNVTPPVLARSITAQTPLNTFIIEITVTDNSPEQSAKIANAVGDELATAVQRISPKSANNVPVVTLQNVARAPVPRVRSAPNTPLMAVTGLGIGLAVGYGFVLLREVLDTRIRSEKDLQRVGETPLLGSISRRPQSRGKGERPPVTLTEPAAEPYRRLATNIEFLDPDTKIGSIVVTSSMPGEGKTTTAINLALAAGELTPRVLLVDADLRRPSVAKYCGIEGAVGLTSVLSGQVSVEDAVEPWSHIHVLTAGTVPPNPSQIVNSNAMADLLVKLSRSFDLVVVDSPPLLPVTDALALSRITDGALIVVRYKATRRQQLLGSLRALEAVKARAIGVVLNRVTEKNKDAEYVYDGSPERRPHLALAAQIRRAWAGRGASSGSHARRRGTEDEPVQVPSERVSEPSER
jgi:capsular exopolysaccharide synthesis family protein